MARVPGDSNPSNSVNGSDGAETWGEIEAALAKAKQRLSEVQDRYQQVRRDLRMQRELEAERAQLQRQPDSAALRAELEDIEQQLSQIEVAIESQLFSWDSFREIFWQIVRFVGLGIVVGWFLRGLVG